MLALELKAWSCGFDLLHKCQHDGLGYHVDHCTADNVEVAGDEEFDDLDFFTLLLTKSATGLESRWRGFHGGHLFLILASEEAAEETSRCLSAVGRERRAGGTPGNGRRWQRLACLGIYLCGSGGMATFVHNSHGLQ